MSGAPRESNFITNFAPEPFAYEEPGRRAADLLR